MRKREDSAVNESKRGVGDEVGEGALVSFPRGALPAGVAVFLPASFFSTGRFTSWGLATSRLLLLGWVLERFGKI